MDKVSGRETAASAKTRGRGALRPGLLALAAAAGSLLIGGTAAAQNVSLGDLNVPQSRLPSWGVTRAGVQGGVPDSRTWPVFRRLSTGWTAAQLQQAVDDASAACASNSACPNGSIPGYVVELPAETRDVGNGSPIFLRSNVVVRGQGADKTRLRVNAAGAGGTDCVNAPGTPGTAPDAFFIACGKHQGFVNVDLQWSGGGPAAGSRTFRLNTSDADWNASMFEPGNSVIIALTSNNDEATPYITREPNGQEYPLQFMATIVARNGGEITTDRALRLDWSRNTPGASGVSCAAGACYQARGFAPLQNAGMEDMLLEGDHKGPIGGTPSTASHSDGEMSSRLIVIQAAKNVWVKGVTARWSLKAPVGMGTTTNVSVVGSELGPSLWARCLNSALWQTCSSSNAGEYLLSLSDGASDALIANNVFVGHAIGVRLRGAQNGNVIAYNYHDGTPSDQRPYGSKSGVSHGTVFVHGFYPHMNLIEGNDSNVALAMVSDCFWGKNGPNTFYRNRANTDGSASAYESDERGWFKTESLGADCSEGNVLIGNHAFAFTDSAGGNYFSGGKNGMSNGIMKDLWFEFNVARDATANSTGRGFNVPDAASNGLDCGLGKGTCARSNDHTYERNFEGPRAPDSWGGFQVPDSLYFASVVDWEQQTGAAWCQEACGWTAKAGIGAFGDDASRSFCSLPAEIRYRGRSCTPRSGTAPSPLPAPVLD